MSTKKLNDIANEHSKRSKYPKGTEKVEKSMHEFKNGELHSGSKKGPKVTNPKQAIAIGLSEQRKKEAGGYK